MFQTTLEVKDPTGLHARPAALLVQKATQFQSDVWLEKDGKKADAKSIMGIMALEITQSCKINILAEGADEEEAVKGLVELIEKSTEQKAETKKRGGR